MPPKMKKTRANTRRRVKTAENKENPSNFAISTSMDRFLRFPNEGGFRARLKSPISVTSTAGGKITNVYTNDPSTGGEWSNFVAIFDSYRVNAMQVDFIPGLILSQATTVTYAGHIYVVFDPDSTAGLATAAAALNHDDLVLASPYKAWSYRVGRMPRIKSASAFAGSYTIYDDGFLDTADHTATSAVQLYAENYAATQLYGQVVVTWDVEFAVRK